MVDRILKLAASQIGEREFPPGTNNVLYNTEYYHGKVTGKQFNWCCVFIWWLFKQLGISDLYYGGNKTAYCPALLSYHQSMGQQVSKDYQPGDIIFFNFSNGSVAQHVGICEKCDNVRITTIDGNTGSGSDANGGAVMRRRRPLRYVVGAYRPNYEEHSMTEQDKNELRKIVREELRNELQYRNSQPANANWQTKAVKSVQHSNLSDGTRPCAFATRAEVFAMFDNLLTKFRDM